MIIIKGNVFDPLQIFSDGYEIIKVLIIYVTQEFLKKNKVYTFLATDNSKVSKQFRQGKQQNARANNPQGPNTK